MRVLDIQAAQREKEALEGLTNYLQQKLTGGPSDPFFEVVGAPREVEGHTCYHVIPSEDRTVGFFHPENFKLTSLEHQAKVLNILQGLGFTLKLQ